MRRDTAPVPGHPCVLRFGASEHSSRRRTLCGALAAIAILAGVPVAAQAARVLRVAWVSTERKDLQSPTLTALREGLEALGYVEGRNLLIEAWWGEGSDQRLQGMAGDIVAFRPDVIVTQGGPSLTAMLRAGVTLPIVFSVSADPVEAKFVQSFARPGGNATGISLFTLAIVGKRMELLREVMPRMKRIAILANPQHPGEQQEFDAATTAAAKLGIKLDYFPAHSEAELEDALTRIVRSGDEAVIAFADGFTMGFGDRIASFSIQNRIPVVSGWSTFARSGNLMTYGPVFDDVYRRLATYVDKIYKGAKPADLPVELPTKVELVINRNTASALGLTIPQSLLVRADDVIQ